MPSKTTKKKRNEAKKVIFSEKDRLYRQRIKDNPEKYAEYLRKERERWHKRKEEKKVKTINDMTPREQRKKRQQWKKAQQRRRAQSSWTCEMTPPNSPESPNQNQPSTSSISTNKILGRKKVKRDKSRCYRELKKVQDELKQKNRLIEMYRKRIYRRELKAKCQEINSITETPRSKTARLLGRRPVSSKVKKTLEFHYCLVDEIKKRMKKRKESRNIIQILKSRKMARYKMLEKVRETFGVKKGSRKRILAKHRVSNLQQNVLVFLERDDCSRIGAGKKCTITRNKIKKQKRFLQDTMKNLHSKFLAEKRYTCSYSLFCRLRPFWIVKSDLNERETCLCQMHDNLNFKLSVLKKHGVIPSDNIDSLVSKICCDVNSKACMYRDCVVCKDKIILPTWIDDDERNSSVKWNKWILISENREKRNADGTKKEYLAKFTGKREVESRMWELVDEMNTGLTRICRHIFNINNQYDQIRKLKANLNSDQAIIHMDFSENYSCKYNSQVQSTHFGSSHNQASLHTVVIYTETATIPVCTISDVLRKDPEAIWAHLTPVLNMVKTDYPGISVLHFISDGPATQYKNKKNFAIFSKKVFEHGFKAASWNFFESSHGKGAPDGIGAVIKRTADRLVAEKFDLPTARDVFEVVKSRTTIRLFFIEGNDFVHEQCYDDVKPVKGTMRIHQIITITPGRLKTRDVSCFCQKLSCLCFQPLEFVMFGEDEDGEGEDGVEDTTRTPVDECNADSHTVPDFLLNGHVIQIDERLIHKWCAVDYENHLYPGIIEDVDDEEIEVTVMHRIGLNKYFWPSMEDRLWYRKNQIIAIIPEMEAVTGRHFRINEMVFNRISLKYEEFRK